MAIRKELLERELSKLGLRKADASRATAGTGASQQEQSHPSADGEGQHGD